MTAYDALTLEVERADTLIAHLAERLETLAEGALSKTGREL
jgi:hypothetical protein